MSTAETDATDAPPPDSRPGRAATDMRDIYRDPGVRNYLFAGLAGLAMVFVILFQRGSTEGGLVVVMLGIAGLALRWTAAPPFMLCVLTYLLLFPFGIPVAGPPDPFEVTAGRFRIADILLAAAVVVYLGAQYRLLGLTHQALPADAGVTKKGGRPELRPSALIGSAELKWFLWVAGGVVLAGQVVWFLVTGLQIVPGERFPVRYVDPSPRFSRPSGGEALNPPAARFVLVTGLIFFTALLARLVFGYWRLRGIRSDEAGMLLQDAGWDESRQELVRVEKWRARGLLRAARRAKKPRSGKEG